MLASAVVSPVGRGGRGEGLDVPRVGRCFSTFSYTPTLAILENRDWWHAMRQLPPF